MKNKTSSKKIICIIFFCVLFIVIGIITYILSGHKEERVQENLELGKKYLDELEYNQALTAYTQVIKLDPKNEEAYFALADIYMATGEYAQAIYILSQGKVKTENTEMDSLLQEAIASLEQLRLNESSVTHPTPTKKQTINIMHKNKSQTVLLSGYLDEDVNITEALFNPGTEITTTSILNWFNISSKEEVIDMILGMDFRIATKLGPTAISIANSSEDDSVVDSTFNNCIKQTNEMSYTEITARAKELDALKSRTLSEDIEYLAMTIVSELFRTFTKAEIEKNIPREVLEQQYWWALEDA